VKKTKKRGGLVPPPAAPGGPAVGVRADHPAILKSALVMVARMAVLDDGLCAGDIIEALNAMGLSSVVAEARRMK
jgi:hypothetical protein